MSRRVYPTSLVINGRVLESVLIDPHYEEKHAESVSDEIILTLVKLLDGKSFRAADVDVDEDGFQYFVNDHMELDGRFYKLICCFMKKNSSLESPTPIGDKGCVTRARKN